MKGLAFCNSGGLTASQAPREGAQGCQWAPGRAKNTKQPKPWILQRHIIGPKSLLRTMSIRGNIPTHTWFQSKSKSRAEGSVPDCAGSGQLSSSARTLCAKTGKVTRTPANIKQQSRQTTGPVWRTKALIKEEKQLKPLNYSSLKKLCSGLAVHEGWASLVQGPN